MIDFLVQPYSQAKSAWSWLNDKFKAAPRADLPRFDTPEALGRWMLENIRYTGDPGGGVFDFYTDPRRLAAAALNPALWASTPCDCDDFAIFACEAAKKIPGTTMGVVTLVGSNVSMIHVIACGWHNGRAFGIDTNGFRWLVNLDEATIVREWNEVYKAQRPGYFAARWTPIPRF